MVEQAKEWGKPTLIKEWEMWKLVKVNDIFGGLGAYLLEKKLNSECILRRSYLYDL